MQTKPANWDTLLAQSHKVEYKVEIDGVEYFAEQMQGIPSISKPLLEKPTIGRVCSATFTVTIRPYEDIPIPRSSLVRVFCRLYDDTGAVTNWLPQGQYYISSRTGRRNITFTCRDFMLKGGQTYLDKTLLDFPATHKAVVNEIANLMGVEIDERTNIREGDSYTISELNSDTLMTEMLAQIGACNGGNWIITETGKLRLIPLDDPADPPTQDLKKAHCGLVDTGDAVMISRVTMQDNSGNEYTAGTDEGIEIYVECPCANQDVVDALGAESGGILYGVTYKPYRISKMFMDPALELGDTVAVLDRSGKESLLPLYSLSVNCNIGYTCDAEAGIDSETDDEYPYKTAQELRDSRSVRTDQKYYGNTISREHGFRSELPDGAFSQFNASGIEFVDKSGNKAFYYDAEKGIFILNGTLGADAIFTDALYADVGDISELTVDRLSTSKHIKKFLLGDTSDDSYILIQDYSIKFISATPTGLYTRLLTEDGDRIITEGISFICLEAEGSTSYEQATNRYGQKLWWQKDISDAEISADGYPFVDGVQVFVTTEETGFPVHVYVYDETVKAEQKFIDGVDSEGHDTFNPIQIWGEGNGYGFNGQGRTEKTAEKFSVLYTTRLGIPESIDMNDDGYVDIERLRKPTVFDFSGIQGGSFVEIIDGNIETTWKVSRDGQGRINLLTDGVGHTTEINWG